MGAFSNINGVWRETHQPMNYLGGRWYGNKIYVNINNVWRKVATLEPKDVIRVDFTTRRGTGGLEG